jgi:hypothetical protein
MKIALEYFRSPSTMHIFAVLLNVLVIGFTGWFAVAADLDQVFLALVLLFIIGPIISIYSLLRKVSIAAKAVPIILNVAMLGAVGYLYFQECCPNIYYLSWFVALIIAPLLTIFALLMRRKP